MPKSKSERQCCEGCGYETPYQLAGESIEFGPVHRCLICPQHVEIEATPAGGHRE